MMLEHLCLNCPILYSTDLQCTEHYRCFLYSRLCTVQGSEGIIQALVFCFCHYLYSLDCTSVDGVVTSTRVVCSCSHGQ